MNSEKLTIIEHIDEIRKRLMVIVVFFIVGFIGSFFLAKPLIKFLQQDGEVKNITLNAFGVIDPIIIYLKVIVFLAIILISPVIMYQIWAFISPGLRDIERKVTLSYIPFAFALTLSGIAFAYFVLLPYVMRFMMNLSSDLNIVQTIGINEYFTFLFQLIIPFSIVFQLPVVLLFFARLGILNPSILVKIRKYAYFGLFVLAAFITPPDLMSHLFVTVPLFILYEVSIFIARFGYRKYLKSEQQAEREALEREIAAAKEQERT